MQHNVISVIRWPVYAIVVLVGGFTLVVMAMWIADHLIEKTPVDETGWIILGASVLRMFTILLAFASLRNWSGKKNYQLLVFAGLCASASAQLVYPVAELFIKLAILSGLYEYGEKGLGNMSLTGWFNFTAVWIIFGVPGTLFAYIAYHFSKRYCLSTTWAWIGGLLGVVVLGIIGFIIG
jgi:MFS family permease